MPQAVSHASLARLDHRQSYKKGPRNTPIRTTSATTALPACSRRGFHQAKAYAASGRARERLKVRTHTTDHKHRRRGPGDHNRGEAIAIKLGSHCWGWWQKGRRAQRNKRTV